MGSAKKKPAKKKEAIVFIDGNNFYHNLKLMRIKPSGINFQKMSEIVCSHYGVNHKKSIYYNSIPSITDGTEMYYSHMSFIESIRKLPKFEVKTRKLQRNSTKEILQEKKEIIDSLDLCKHCKPLVKTNCFDCIGNIKKREKGIDVMIAVDMLNLSVIRRECDCCILISGDADFVPVMNLIKEKGIGVCSASLPRGYAYELRKTHKFFFLSRNLLLERCMK